MPQAKPEVGDTGELVGLLARTDLNGRRVEVEARVAAKKGKALRYVVRVLGEDEEEGGGGGRQSKVKVKAANLKLDRSGPEPAAEDAGEPVDLKTHEPDPDRIPVPGDPGVPPGSRTIFGKVLLPGLQFLTLEGDDEEFVLVQADAAPASYPSDPNTKPQEAARAACDSLNFTFRYLAAKVSRLTDGEPATALGAGFWAVKAGLLEWAHFYQADLTSIRSSADPRDNLREEPGLAEWHPKQGSLPPEFRRIFEEKEKDRMRKTLELLKDGLKHVRL